MTDLTGDELLKTILRALQKNSRRFARARKAKKSRGRPAKARQQPAAKRSIRRRGR